MAPASPRRVLSSVVAAAAVAAVATAACGIGAIGLGDDDACEPVADAPPATPAIAEPTPGHIDILPDTLVMSSSAFSDPDPGNGHAGSEFEVWTVVGGQLTARVWTSQQTSEQLDPTKLTRVTLADGVYEGIAAGVGLLQWQDYAVRVRYRDDASGCGAWSAWSEPRVFRTDDGSTYLFDASVVRDVYLDIPPESWAQIDAEAVPPGCVNFRRNYYPGTLRFEGQTFDDVGIRTKGGCGSSRGLAGKASFKINLAWDDPAVPGCPGDRRLYGQKALTLNNGVQDGTFEHERLTYTLYQSVGVPAPRSAHVRLWVNGQLWGVYNDIETINRRFVERWFPDSRGMMYEGAYWCDLIQDRVNESLTDTGCLSREFETDACNTPDPGDDPTDWVPMQTLVSAIAALPEGGFYPEVEQFFDFDRFLSMWAVEGVVAHWDSYSFHILNNYRVYHDPSTGLWTMIPWGTDQTFLGDLDPWDSDAVLVRRCLSEPDCEAAFATRLEQVTATFEQLGMSARAQQIHAVISADVMADPRKEFDNASYDTYYNDLLTWIAGRPQRVREILASRGH